MILFKSKKKQLFFLRALAVLWLCLVGTEIVSAQNCCIGEAVADNSSISQNVSDSSSLTDTIKLPSATKNTSESSRVCTCQCLCHSVVLKAEKYSASSAILFVKSSSTISLIQPSAPSAPANELFRPPRFA